MIIVKENTPVQILDHPVFEEKGVKVMVKRDDLTHPEIQGNKWRKLKYNLQQAELEEKKTLITLGGGFSNHIAATAAAGKYFQFNTIGIIRGDELDEKMNLTLVKAANYGMKLYFVDRETYRKLSENPESLLAYATDAYVLPEGGTNAYALKGCKEILNGIDEDYDQVAVSIGTGGTFAGILDSLHGEKKLLGFSALKGNWIEKSIHDLLQINGINYTNFDVLSEDKFGGYGRFNQELIQFILEFNQQFAILLDPIYTAKLFYSVWDMIKNEQIARGTRLLIIHTGGLQGISGFNVRHHLALPNVAQQVL